MGGSAPNPDPAMGEAALMSAKTGEKAFSWGKELAGVSRKWARQDRNRQIKKFLPIENDFIDESLSYDTPGRRRQESIRAGATAGKMFDRADEARARSNAAMGIRPDSGRARSGDNASDIQRGLGIAGAAEMARRNVESQGVQRKAAVINMGKGLAVNPGTSIQTAGSTGMAGHQAAMEGYGQQGRILGAQHEAQMNAWAGDQNRMAGIMGGIGGIAGMMMSDEDKKEDKAPAKGALGAVRRMRVDSWKYKDGVEDGGRHVGTYAQDFKRETGLGDGKSISAVDAIGVTMGAVKELADKVEALGTKRPKKMERAA